MKKWTRREIFPLVGASLVAGTAFSLGTDPEKQAPFRMPPIITRPKSLAPGDYIGICAPAGALRRDAEIPEFTAVLQKMGFRVKVGPNCTKKYGYFAGTDEERASDFMQFIKDPEVKAIFFLRGGWGAARILEHLDFDIIADNPKIIMGFSDATTLLCAITTKSSLVTFHGPSGNSSWNDYSMKYIRQVLVDRSRVHYENTAEDEKIITYSPGTASGLLWGGNLSVIASLIGTRYLPIRTPSILFLEDVGEEPYSIDRMLTQLKLCGVLRMVNGVVLGNFRKCDAEEPERSFTLHEVFQQHFENFGKPVYYGAQIGHTVNKFTIPVGVDATMNADKGTITLTYPAVL